VQPRSLTYVSALQPGSARLTAGRCGAGPSVGKRDASSSITVSNRSSNRLTISSKSPRSPRPSSAHYDGTVSPLADRVPRPPPYRRGISGQAARCSPHRRMGPNSRPVPGNFKSGAGQSFNLKRKYRRLILVEKLGPFSCPVRRSALGTRHCSAWASPPAARNERSLPPCD
jgi:hypothetical protein